MIDIPKIELCYKKRIDWEGTIANMPVGAPRLWELNPSQYNLLNMARKSLREQGIVFRTRLIYGTSYVIERMS